MLIITRRVNETFVIGDDIKITILGHKNGQTRIGIDAPRELSVHRLEVYERIKLQNELDPEDTP